MKNNIVDGSALAETAAKRLEKKFTNLKGQGVKPTILVFSFEESAATKSYLGKKESMAKRLGVRFVHRRILAAHMETAVKKIEQDLKRYKPAGAIIQLPVPRNFDRQAILDAIPNEYDIDGLSSASIGRQVSGGVTFVPPVAGAVMEILKSHKIPIRGKDVTVIGWGPLVGKPVSAMMLSMGATVSICHQFTSNIAKKTKGADIVVTGVGKPNIVTGAMIAPSAVVIDVGFTMKNKKLYGDVDVSSVQKKAKLVTTVPGGVGPITVVKLFENLAIAARMQAKLKG